MRVQVSPRAPLLGGDMGKLQKWQEEKLKQISFMTNEELVEVAIECAPGDDNYGYFTSRGYWYFAEVQRELSNRMVKAKFTNRPLKIQ